MTQSSSFLSVQLCDFFVHPVMQVSPLNSRAFPSPPRNYASMGSQSQFPLSLQLGNYYSTFWLYIIRSVNFLSQYKKIQSFCVLWLVKPKTKQSKLKEKLRLLKPKKAGCGIKLYDLKYICHGKNMPQLYWLTLVGIVLLYIFLYFSNCLKWESKNEKIVK